MTSGEFQTTLDVRQVGKDTWQLLSDLVFVTSWGWKITVPAGFTTDFFSTPRPIWWLLPKSGEYDSPAVVHDWAYRTHLVRWLGDGLIYDAMNSLSIAKWKTWLTYFFLRLLGWYAWNHEPKIS